MQSYIQVQAAGSYSDTQLVLWSTNNQYPDKVYIEEIIKTLVFSVALIHLRIFCLAIKNEKHLHLPRETWKWNCKVGLLFGLNTYGSSYMSRSIVRHYIFLQLKNLWSKIQADNQSSSITLTWQVPENWFYQITVRFLVEEQLSPASESKLLKPMTTVVSPVVFCEFCCIQMAPHVIIQQGVY